MSGSDNLVASHPGNAHAQRSSVFARRNLALDPEVQDLTAAVMAAPHVDVMDEAGATEIAKLMVLIDRIDADLAARGVTTDDGDPRGLLDIRRRFSGQLERWLASYGMTPAARAELVRDVAVATGSLAHDIERRRAAARGEQS